MIQKLIVAAAILLTVSTTPHITAGTGIKTELRLCKLKHNHIENNLRVCVYICGHNTHNQRPQYQTGYRSWTCPEKFSMTTMWKHQWLQVSGADLYSMWKICEKIKKQPGDPKTPVSAISRVFKEVLACLLLHKSNSVYYIPPPHQASGADWASAQRRGWPPRLCVHIFNLIYCLHRLEYPIGQSKPLHMLLHLLL